MKDWDDIRFFLAVARCGSVRAASEQLGVNHSTVLRRIAQLEAQLGAHLFDRLPSGYRLTEAGTEVLASARSMEASSHELHARVFGRDQGVRGRLRVTMPPVVATHLLMEDLAAFARLYPDVEIEVLSLDDPVNLTNREADVAIRNVYDRAGLPHNLYGLRGPEVFWSVFMSRDLLTAWCAGEVESVRWLVKKRYGQPEWCRRSDVPASPVPFKVSDAAAQILAVRQGLGMTLLPCFVGDADPQLVRVPGGPVRMHGTLWILTHGETRKTRRVRLFTEFVAKRLAAYEALLAGRAPAAVASASAHRPAGRAPTSPVGAR